MKKNIAVYIDGFNYYYAILNYMRNNTGHVPLKWLDYRHLVETHILKHTNYSKKALFINFYTAINGYRSKDSQQRHNTYLNALRATNINVVKGYYKLRDVQLSCHIECNNCKMPVFIKKYMIDKTNSLNCSKCNSFIDISQKNIIQHPEEKQTDTNIAKDILIDVSKDKFDICYLFSTDSDFVPVADYVINECGKEFFIVAPDTKILKNVRQNDGTIITKFELRYGINKFTSIGAQEYRLKMGRLNRYLLPQNVGTIKKPIGW